MALDPLTPDELRRRCDPAQFAFATTADVAPLERTIGQDRALRAIEFGLGIETRGYNIFVTGPIGTGKRTTVEAELERHAAGRDTPGDWAYVFNFDEPERPLALLLPSATARAFAREMTRLVDDVARALPRAFESDRYQQRRRELVESLEARREEGLTEVRTYALQRGLALEVTPAGLATIPIVDGKPITPQVFQTLPPERQRAFRDAGKEVEQRMTQVMTELRTIERDARERLRELDREVALFAAGHLVDDVKARHHGQPEVLRWLDDVGEDVIEHLDHFRSPPQEEGLDQLPAALAGGLRRARQELLERYAVNVFVAQDGAGAPVVVEHNPTYPNLFGRLDYETVLGGATTSHLNVRPGAVHRANGGYLMVNAIDAISRPFVWDKLKEVLRAGRVQVENIGEQFTLFPTRTLRPAPIDLKLKVVMVGPLAVHQLLYELDEDMRKLFKVRADFDDRMPWTDAEAEHYAAFVSGLAREGGLRHLDPAAVALVVEQGARAAEDQGKLSTELGSIGDLVAEASHWAGVAGREHVTAADVAAAIEEKLLRTSLIPERIRELIAEGTLLVTVEGERAGQLNGLSVAAVGDTTFGQPVRITAAISVGDGDVLSIDREVKLTGPIHNKGFLILAGYLRERYGGGRPLSLRASLVFEQSYGEIEGDSASSAELYALLSALADAPIRQGIAVTGSVNQRGEVQPIGGVNEKVEGFFAVCREHGLTGEQGVIVPAANARNLMLRDEVVEAVRAGTFHVWAVATIDAGLELLTGLDAGERDADGGFPEGTLHRRVDDRLAELAEVVREFGGAGGGGAEGAAEEDAAGEE